MKRNILFVVLALVMLFSVSAFSADEKNPVISDLATTDGLSYKVGQRLAVKYTFTSDQKPDEVLVWKYSIVSPLTKVNDVYSTKGTDNMVRLISAISKDDGKYEVTISVRVGSPVPAKYDLDISIKNFSGKKSNVLKSGVEFL